MIIRNAEGHEMRWIEFVLSSYSKHKNTCSLCSHGLQVRYWELQSVIILLSALRVDTRGFAENSSNNSLVEFLYV
jgi:hypothetical protein